MKLSFTIFCLLTFHTALIIAQPIGFLDTSFGTEGKQVITLGAYSYGGFRKIAIQKDGKILATGHSSNKLGIARFHVNGTLDNTFGMNGKVETQVGSPNFVNYLDDIKIQDDGKILAGGYARNTDLDFALVRYHSNGLLDSSFGEFGQVLTDLTGRDDLGKSLAIQKDGKIIVAGHCLYDTEKTFIGLSRYLPNGTLDSTFGVTGKILIEKPHASVVSVLVQEDNKILVGGNVNGFGFMLLRFEPDGKPDHTFGLKGFVLNVFKNNSDRANTMTLQSDGKIILAGVTHAIDFYGSAALARYNSDGSLDNSFGNGGKVISDMIAGSDGVNDVLVQKDGKIIAVGYGVGFLLWRYNEDGTFDKSFGWGGQIATQFLPASSSASSCALQGDDKLIIAGSVGSKECGLARHYIGPALVSSIDPFSTSNITLLPNPVEDYFFVDLHDDLDFVQANFKIFDVTGRLVFYGTLSENSQTRISGNELKPGVYNLLIEKNGRKTCLQLVK